MPRHFFRSLAVYGLAGLAVNVFIAWGFAAWGDASEYRWFTTTNWDICGTLVPPEHVGPLHWTVAPVKEAEAPEDHFIAFGTGVRVTSEREPRVLGDVPRIHVRIADFGWPFLAMRWHEVEVHRSRGVISAERGWWLNLPAGLGDFGGLLVTPRRLPLEPIWSGFVGNSLLYGSTLMAFLLVMRGTRDVNRLRRGLCPACAYDLRGDHAAGCPECGWGRVGTTP